MDRTRIGEGGNDLHGATAVGTPGGVEVEVVGQERRPGILLEVKAPPIPFRPVRYVPILSGIRLRRNTGVAAGDARYEAGTYLRKRSNNE